MTTRGRRGRPTAHDRQAALVRFTCEHCGATVDGIGPVPIARNSCPACGWSKHTLFGTDTYRPCGAMMRPHDRGDGSATWRCLGCGWMVTAPTEARMDQILAGGSAFGVTGAGKVYGEYADDEEYDLMEAAALERARTRGAGGKRLPRSTGPPS